MVITAPVILDHERPFKLYPRRPQTTTENSPHWKASSLRRITAMAKTIARANNRTGPKVRVPCPSCIVRTSKLRSTQSAADWRAHGNYLVRTGTPAFDAIGDVSSPEEMLAKWHEEQDSFAYKIVISPERAGDLQFLTRETMRRTGEDLTFLSGIKADLEWVAAPHYDSDHPHVHVALRARAGGKEFFLPQDMVRRGMRRHAQATLARQLGIEPLERSRNERSVSGVSSDRSLG